ncbi:C40 family peptidase [Streptomyces sp. ISL-100]|uniref:C40 family peptidase n=1 Tax=Streptomyces sp. ISL-100 TaxID=2819173 RepID=UPI001BE7B813|nr:NlpC/P60 family protein [Streptomyces sp. ISL-100]MBT2400637.1 C40 family peptidase [Streptomyces sp. ISL-100]
MATNLAVAILVTGAGAALVWTGFTNPEEGLISEIGKVLRGEPTSASKRGGIKGIGAAGSAAGVQQIRDAGGNVSSGGGGGGGGGGDDGLAQVSAPGIRGKVLAEARRHLGKSYIYGAKGPNAFDCSGLVQYVYGRAAGMSIPAPSQTQALRGKSVSEANAQVGDLVCYGYPAHHIGIYVGGGQLLHAANPNKGVVIESVKWNGGRYYRNVLGRSGETAEA